ncbi:LAGLIDADG family homing endonuclease [Neobacillus sp. SAB-20_R2A]|uniref:LAGLIDADG family homing endonuclease n=1 Tax=Neobacillus sp. SAB-20_R2A TaxID=3120519 RepID=UPI003C6E88AB
MEIWEASYVAGVIDGEGSIVLTRIHENEFRRPCITIASTDMELLIYIQSIVGGDICSKKNYKPTHHKDSYTLNIKKKKAILKILKDIAPYLRVNKKRKRALWILENYEKVTPRNGKYNSKMLEKKKAFEEFFFQI